MAQWSRILKKWNFIKTTIWHAPKLKNINIVWKILWGGNAKWFFERKIEFGLLRNRALPQTFIQSFLFLAHLDYRTDAQKSSSVRNESSWQNFLLVEALCLEAKPVGFISIFSVYRIANRRLKHYIGIFHWTTN